MNPKFSKYSLEQLLEEKSFISWIIEEDNKTEWDKFIKSDPAFYSKINKAREIIRLLKDKYDVLDPESILEIWKNIDEFERQYLKKVRKFNFKRTFSWAASFLIIVSIGIIGYYLINGTEKVFQFTSTDIIESDEAQMILQSGEKIKLKKENSTITMSDAANQVSVNDSIIELTPITDIKGKEPKMNEVIIPYGKKSELLLADGTKVWLNAGSRLAFPSKFTKNKREVFLEGEACFKVAENRDQPFVVKAGKLDIKVLGTHFNVSAYPTDNTIETVLLEGSVAVEKPKTFGLGKDEIILAPNQKASFKKEQNNFSVTDETDADIYIAWTYGWLKYNRESLISVMRKVERYYNVEIHLPDNYPQDDKITGKLDLKESLKDAMETLADASGTAFKILGDQVYVEKKLGRLPKRE